MKKRKLASQVEPTQPTGDVTLSYSAMLAESLAGTTPEGVDLTIDALRDEWERGSD